MAEPSFLIGAAEGEAVPSSVWRAAQGSPASRLPRRAGKDFCLFFPFGSGSASSRRRSPERREREKEKERTRRFSSDLPNSPSFPPLTPTWGVSQRPAERTLVRPSVPGSEPRRFSVSRARRLPSLPPPSNATLAGTGVAFPLAGLSPADGPSSGGDSLARWQPLSAAEGSGTAAVPSFSLPPSPRSIFFFNYYFCSTGREPGDRAGFLPPIIPGNLYPSALAELTEAIRPVPPPGGNCGVAGKVCGFFWGGGVLYSLPNINSQ